MTPHFSSRTGNQDSTPSEYRQPIPQKMQLHGPDELGILQYISEWERTTDYPGCSHVLSLHSDLELESASTDGRCLICLQGVFPALMLKPMSLNPYR